MLPIFDPERFTEEQKELIPKTGDEEHPELYVDYAGLIYTLAVEWMELDETPALIGPAGVGKTEGLRHVAWLMQAPFRRLSFNAESDPDDIIGKWVFQGGETRFIEGRLTKGWKEDGVILMDEPNTSPDSVWQVIRPLTDNSKQLVLDTATGQHVTRADYCFPGMAMNPSWDARNIGTREIADADGNRLAVMFIGMPPDAVERHILIERCKLDGYELPAATLNSIMKVAADIREAADPEHGHLPITWGLRPQIAVARKTKWYSFEMAYRRAVTDRLEPQTANQILQYVGDHMEGKKKHSTF
jgi:MoxR-like ATPase